MFWNMTVTETERAEDFKPQGRFVLHRHCDADGAHLDLRLESEGHAVGYRIGGVALADGAWATEKMPHPLHWLEQDGDAVREDAGLYRIVKETPEARELELHGASGVRVVRFAKETGLDAAAVRAIALALRGLELPAAQAAALLCDGALARREALDRLCSLGRELDGVLFDEARWRDQLAAQSLEDIAAQVRAFQARFNHKYPPAPVSKPEPLEDATETERMLALVRGV